MTTTNANRDDSWIVLDDAAVATLREIAMYGAQSVGDEMQRVETSHELAQYLDQVKLHLVLWRAADQGRIRAEDASKAVDRVRAYRDDMLLDLRHDASGREKLLAGDDGWAFAQHSSLDENLAIYASQIDRSLDRLAGCDSFLRANGVEAS